MKVLSKLKDLAVIVLLLGLGPAIVLIGPVKLFGGLIIALVAFVVLSLLWMLLTPDPEKANNSHNTTSKAKESQEKSKDSKKLIGLEALITSASHLFNTRENEEWFGDLWETFECMKMNDFSRLQIWTHCLYELISFFVAAMWLRMRKQVSKAD